MASVLRLYTNRLQGDVSNECWALLRLCVPPTSTLLFVALIQVRCASAPSFLVHHYSSQSIEDEQGCETPKQVSTQIVQSASQTPCRGYRYSLAMKLAIGGEKSSSAFFYPRRSSDGFVLLASIFSPLALLPTAMLCLLVLAPTSFPPHTFTPPRSGPPNHTLH
jgi:hypothetical protein